LSVLRLSFESERMPCGATGSLNPLSFQVRELGRPPRIRGSLLFLMAGSLFCWRVFFPPAGQTAPHAIDFQRWARCILSRDLPSISHHMGGLSCKAPLSPSRCGWLASLPLFFVGDAFFEASKQTHVFWEGLAPLGLFLGGKSFREANRREFTEGKKLSSPKRPPFSSAPMKNHREEGAVLNVFFFFLSVFAPFGG